MLRQAQARRIEQCLLKRLASIPVARRASPRFLRELVGRFTDRRGVQIVDEKMLWLFALHSDQLPSAPFDRTDRLANFHSSLPVSFNP